MNQNIIFGLLIVFLILIIILLILLLIFPKETKSLGIGLGICSIITIIIGGLYTKNIDNNLCACGKGECKKCGGINNIDDITLKSNLLLLSSFINKISKKTPQNPKDEEELNKLLNSINENLAVCNNNTASRQFHTTEVLFKTVNLTSKDYENFTDRYESHDVIGFISEIPNTKEDKPPLNITVKNKTYELIGFIETTGAHFIAYVKYAKGWFWRDSLQSDTYDALNTTTLNGQDIQNKLNELYYKTIAFGQSALTYVLYRDVDRTQLQNGSPPIFKQFDNICYIAAPLQLLLATDLLDNEEVKSEEVKSEEVKSEEVKSEEEKAKEEKANEIIEEAKKNLPKLQQLQTEIDTLSNNIFKDFEKIPDNYNFLEENTIWHIKGKIKKDIFEIRNKNEKDIEFINDKINNPKLKESQHFYTDFIPMLEKMNTNYDKNINEINKNIELVNQHYNTLKILNVLTSDFIEFEKEYNKNNFSNAEIEKKIIQIKENIQNTFKEFKGKIQIKEDIEKVKENIKLVKTQITELSTKKLSPKKESKEDVDTLTASAPSSSPVTTSTTPAPSSPPTPALTPGSTMSGKTTSTTPAPSPSPVTTSTTPALTPGSTMSGKTTSTTPTPIPAPKPAPAPTLVSTMSSKTTSSLPVYEFSTGEIEEAWEKELSTSKPKRVENTNTEFDKYLNKLLKENV